MNKRKKNILLVCIYMIMLLLCFFIVLLIQKLNSPHVEKGGGSKAPIESTAVPYTEEEPETEDNAVAGESTGKEEDAQVEGHRASAVQPEMTWEEPEEKVKPYVPPVIVIASDVHYFSPELTDYGEAFGELEKRDDGKVVRYIPQIMDAFTDQMEKKKPTAVILSGDLTLNGEKKGHEALAEKLTALEEKGVKVLVIPGNHDINNHAAASYFGKEKEPVQEASAKDFYDIYRRFGYDQARSLDQNSLSYVYELDEKNWLLMVDSAQYEPYNKVGGRIKEETLGWMKTQLEEAKKLGVTVVVIAHHNLLKESILYPQDCTLENSGEVVSLLESFRVPLYISGHLHLQKTKTYRREPGEKGADYHISEVVANSFAISPNQYGVLNWTGDNRLVYTTEQTDVEDWGKKTGTMDENLLHFNGYAEKSLKDVVYEQVSSQIKNLPNEQIEQMAMLYGDLNRDYCAGKPIDAKEIKSTAAYRLWQRNLPDSRLFAQIDEILRDTSSDHNTWEGTTQETKEDDSNENDCE
ncbi:metallophosphoesterase [Lacrimispora amygdalina]|uniref:Metallophosphoesterase n=1 Tax=Lacrimispora amygdalina TaxID=253257 RepID=A0A3E2NAL5_9FIRM|nr:metallophosphoesterase [Clostridium indicum]RFZ78033.1 metallophosphoesterase [Clostridium indicum]